MLHLYFMQYIQGTNRNQAVLFSENLDQIVDADNEVRLIDVFVESIKMEDYSFEMHHNSEGRPVICYFQNSYLKTA